MKKATFVSSLLVAFALGGAGMWAWHQHWAANPQTVAAHGMSADGKTLAQSGQPFVAPVMEMEQMQRRMEQFFNQEDFFSPGVFSGNFGSWFNTADGGFGTKIQEGEDEHSIFFKMKVGDKDVSDVNVTVDNGYVSINAEITDKTANAYSHSSVSQSFPVPVGADPDSAKIDQEGDSIVIRFDKLS
jgi:HSP20 family molecular chaperone IbpA